MKLAVVGSREIRDIKIGEYINNEVTEIVSGGAAGVDTIAKEYALSRGIKYTEFLPKYSVYGRGAPIKRNEEIAKYADGLLAFWDGKSKGTQNVIKLFQKLEKSSTVVIVNKK